MILRIFLVFSFLSSCSTIKTNSLLQYKRSYIYKDQSGQFELTRETGEYKHNQIFTKYIMFDSNNKEIEKSVAISKKELFNNKYKRLVPVASRYVTWIENSKKSVISNLKKLDLVFSTKNEYNKEVISFDSKKLSYNCYLIQIVECAIYNGFIKEAISKRLGLMRLSLIIEGNPYFSEQYLYSPTSRKINAIFSFDGLDKDKNYRFTLKFGRTMIFYILDKNLRLEKMLWPAEGLSIEKSYFNEEKK